MEEIKASAEAVKAIAETTGKALDTANKVGGFFSRVLGPAFEEFGGMVHDQVRFLRSRRLLRVQKKYEEIRVAHGLINEKPLNLKVALPLLEAASIETNDDLQDMFARLLVNGTNPNSGIEIKRTFVSILQDFGPLEARLLLVLCNAPGEKGHSVRTVGLPDKYVTDKKEDEPAEPPPDIALALWILVRLGCIEPAVFWGGTDISIVTVTLLGRALFEACTVKGNPFTSANV